MKRVLVLLVLALSLEAQQDQQKPNIQTGWPCTGKERAFDPAYLATAEATGGQMFLFDRSEVRGFSVMEIGSRQHPATVARAVGTLDQYRDIQVPVDASIESLFFSISLQCMQRIVIYDPQSSEVLPAQTGGADDVFRAGRMATVPKPQPGVWTVRLLGSGTYSVVVQAKTPLGLHNVNLEGESITAYVSGGASGIRFRLVNEAGDALEPLALDPLPGGGYSGTLATSAHQFRLMMEGADERGGRIQRMDPRLFMRP